MPRVDFSRLPDHGRVWVFPASRRLESPEVERLLSEVDGFLDDWAAHGVPLRSARKLSDRQFRLVGVDEDAEAPSGCSIDALVNRLKELGSGLGVTLVEHGPVWFRDGPEVRTASRPEFRRLVGEGRVTPDTPVFDTSLTRLAELRSRGLECPAQQSWHGRAFFGKAQTG
jgi:hypothetical protein